MADSECVSRIEASTYATPAFVTVAMFALLRACALRPHQVARNTGSSPPPRNVLLTDASHRIRGRRYYCFLFFQTYSKLYLLSRRARKPDSASGGGLRTALGINPYRYHDAATAAVKYSNTHDPLAILGDRMVGNTLEQLVPFLGSLWLYALFVDPERTRLTGAVYITARALYPPLFWAGSPWILLSTIPGYAIIAYQLVAVLCALRAPSGPPGN